MKIKRLFSVLGLALFGFASVGAGVLAAPKKSVEPAVADEPDTWMINISADLRGIVEFDGFDSDSVWVQTFTEGVGDSKWFHMYPVRTGSMFYQVNASFPESYTYDRIQFKFSQGGVEKWGTPNDTVVTQSKDNDASQTYVTFAETWTGDNWNVHYSTSPGVHVQYNDVAYPLEPDIPNKRFIATDVISDGSDYFTCYYRQGWGDLLTVVTDHSKEVLGHVDAAWSNMPAGTYTVELKNNNGDNGVLDVIKHEAASDTYIYYVLENNTPTNDYIYAWGGSEQFGIWPGKKITEIEGCEEVTRSGVLHFEGSETAKLIYRIPVSIAHPSDGDVYFKFNNNNDWESEQRTLKSEHAYWYTGAANYDAAKAIEFLCAAEDIRNAAADYSVCNISVDDAKTIVNAYNALDSVVRTEYVDKTTVYTYKIKAEERTELEPNELVSYKKVVEKLGEIAGIEVVGSNIAIRKSNANFDSQTIIIIASIVVASIMGLTVLHIVRRRAHN